MGPKGPIIGCQDDPWLYVTPAALQSVKENTKKIYHVSKMVKNKIYNKINK